MEVDVIFCGEELTADWREITIVSPACLSVLTFVALLSLLFDNFLTLYEMPAFAVSSLSRPEDSDPESLALGSGRC